MRLTLQQATDPDYEARVTELIRMQKLLNGISRRLRLMVNLGYYGIPSYGDQVVLSSPKFVVSRLGTEASIEGILAFFDYQVFGLTHTSNILDNETKIAQLIREARREIEYVTRSRSSQSF